MVKVIGENETAQRARAYLAEGDVYLVEHSPLFTFKVLESKELVCPVVDGVDSPLEARFVSLLTELSPAGRVVLARKGGNQNDRALVITVPAKPEERHAAALAILRVCLQLAGRKRRWLPAWLGLVLVLIARSAIAGETGYMSPRAEAGIKTAFARAVAEQIQGGSVDQGQPGILPWLVSFSAPQHVICDGGTCGGASAYLDNAVFTAGSSAVNPIGCVFDDSIANLTTGHAGAPRCTVARGLHINVRDANGNEMGTASSPFRVQGAANASTNITLFAGSAVVTGVGGSGAGIPRFTPANDSAIAMHGVAKSSTAAGDVTSTNASSTRQPADVTLYSNLGVAYRSDQIRALTSSGDSVGALVDFDAGNVSSTNWTSATAVDSVVSIPIGNRGSASVSITAAGATFSAGQLNFEISPDNVNWYQFKLTRVDVFSTDTTFSLNGFASTQAWQVGAGGFATVRVRLNPAITGAGTLTVQTLQTAVPMMPSVTIGGALSPPVGGATAAKQDTGNASLASIDTKLTSPITVTEPGTKTGQTAAGVNTVQFDENPGRTLPANHEYTTPRVTNFRAVKVSLEATNGLVLGENGSSPLYVGFSAGVGGSVQSFTANGQSYTFGASSADGKMVGSYVFHITNTFVGTIEFQGRTSSADAFTALSATNMATGVVATTTTTTGFYVMPSSYLWELRLVTTAWTSGQADVTASTSPEVMAPIVAAPINITSLPLPAGAATGAKQDTGNASLASIDAKLTNPLPVSAASLPLPTNAATEPTLSSVKSNTDKLDIFLSSLRDAITAGGANAKTLNDLYTQLSAVAVSVASLDTKITAINGMQNVLSTPTRGLPLPACNPVRRTNCQSKGF